MELTTDVWTYRKEEFVFNVNLWDALTVGINFLNARFLRNVHGLIVLARLERCEQQVSAISED